jgi:hypothetical protein
MQCCMFMRMQARLYGGDGGQLVQLFQVLLHARRLCRQHILVARTQLKRLQRPRQPACMRTATRVHQLHRPGRMAPACSLAGRPFAALHAPAGASAAACKCALARVQPLLGQQARGGQRLGPCVRPCSARTELL